MMVMAMMKKPMLAWKEEGGKISCVSVSQPARLPTSMMTMTGAMKAQMK